MMADDPAHSTSEGGQIDPENGVTEKSEAPPAVEEKSKRGGLQNAILMGTLCVSPFFSSPSLTRRI
jgi:hypothetical protein